MNLISRKPKPVPAEETDVIGALHRRIIEMDADDRADLKLQLALEKTAGSASSDAAAANAAQAEAFLKGEEFTLRDKPASPLALVLARRKIRALARDIASSRHCKLAAERASEIWNQYFDEIAAMEKRRVLLALELQKTNRARELLREKITAAGGAGFLSTDSVELLHFGDVHDEVNWAAERIIADGIATRSEIERAKAK